MSNQQPTRTAEWLGALRSELVTAGFGDDEAFALCRDALSDSFRNGEGITVNLTREVAA